ncbi:AfsR/SARP family transcriptional regulator [Amycolatopsis rubida]|uniref:AfsR/SARP family transcriptional regulator n=1 Tax=Amycolatopsis rubida TaxID=112413 RepID=A0ABX0BUW1_9PSEU|nr:MULTISPECIES: AfsR/SARP family transcriptional regulator [Amycolatopsis]MYW94157.1 SARP family transcriptional regulator [Amycolatopsis rubida]NEC59146.1 AfsR/SARP family transcriptional regulator [Amycolatopsis rubida]OAP20928.1 Transcriptional regulatory protein MoaR1 [Amycolatopsis sp. M39]
MYSAKDQAVVDHRSGEPGGTGVRFTVLGPLGVVRDGVETAPTTPKLLQLLALLILRPGKLVHADAIAQELWASTPPRTMRTTLHTYVYHLRRCLGENGPDRGAGSALVTKTPGYVFRIDPAQVDVFRFARLQREGEELLRGERHSAAAERFRAALDVWTGPPLANVPCGPMLVPYTVELLEQRRAAVHMLIEAEIASGRHRELIGELCSLTAGNPLDETLHGQLMRALGRSGRRYDAMSVYRALRNRLHEELGVEPCDEIQLLHRDLISEGGHR